MGTVLLVLRLRSSHALLRLLAELAAASANVLTCEHHLQHTMHIIPLQSVAP
jgi:hypothetical protein